MTTDQLITKYRPTEFKQVIGQPNVVKALLTMMDGRVHSFMFGGAPGLGKTTLAHVCAKALDCSVVDEFDAVTNSGVDEMREKVRLVNYPPLEGGRRAIIVDEAHGLSAKAWDSLLIQLEYPAPFNYWFFSTTLPGKMPKAVAQRCACFTLTGVNDGDIVDLLWDISEAEKLEPAPLADVVKLCAVKANGSPRQAIQNFAKTWHVDDIESAQELLDELPGTSEGFQLAQLISKGGRWDELALVASKLDPSKIESARYVVVNYMSKVVLGAKGEKLREALNVLEAFSKPFPTGEGLSPLLLALAKVEFK